MKPLPKQFKGRGEVQGYDFLQICETDKGFIYEVSFGEYKHYEVFRKCINRRFNTIAYPTSKAFGLWAWTCMSLDKALGKLNSL